MTLIRLIQRATILTGIAVGNLFFQNTSARAESCIITDKGKEICGTPVSIPRMCITTDSKNNICGKFTRNKNSNPNPNGGEEASKPTQSTGYRKDVGDIVFLLKACKKSDRVVKCYLTVKTKGAEPDVFIGGYYSKIIDSMGKSHSGNNVEFGGKSAYDGVTTHIYTGIDYDAIITFNDIQGQIIQANVLNINIGGINAPNSTLQFRNISFTN